MTPAATKQASGLFVTVNGEPTPLTDLSWYQTAPCGCTCAVTLAETEWYVIATEADAWRRFYEDDDPSLMKRDQERGYVLDLDAISKVKERLQVRCPHEPKWGVPPTPGLEGFAWAAPSALNVRRNARLHLIPADSVDTQDWRAPYPDTACGESPRKRWTAQRWDTAGRIECSRCLRVATAAVSA